MIAAHPLATGAPEAPPEAGGRRSAIPYAASGAVA